MIATIHGEMDETLLQRREVLVDNANERSLSIEHCLLDCAGAAHRSGMPDSPGHFCALHVKRSAQVVLKRGVSGGSAVGGFGG